jgi:hypothetical protein
MPRRPETDPIVQLHPPLTSVAWSADFVAQSLEVLFIYLDAQGAHNLRPIHAETLRLGWSPQAKPGEIVLEAAERYELKPLLVHSTSWRHEEGRLILTYIAVVDPPVKLTHYLADELTVRADLARGDAFGPPPEIGVAQVLEHAFRHLAWLVKDDEVVGTQLSDWAHFLSDFTPEPFRAFGPAV